MVVGDIYPQAIPIMGVDPQVALVVHIMHPEVGVVITRRGEEQCPVVRKGIGRSVFMLLTVCGPRNVLKRYSRVN